MRWSLERTEEILFSPSSSSWSSRWLDVLNDADRDGDWADGGRMAEGSVFQVFRSCSDCVCICLHFKLHNVSQAGPGLKESCHVAPRLSPRDPRIWIWRPHVLQIDQRSH